MPSSVTVVCILNFSNDRGAIADRMVAMLPPTSAVHSEPSFWNISVGYGMLVLVEHVK